MWTPPGLHVDSIWKRPQCTILYKIQVDSIWTPYGIQMESKWTPGGLLYLYNYQKISVLFTPPPIPTGVLVDSRILTGVLLDLGIPTIFKSNWILKIQVITYRLTNINYIVPGCHRRSSGVVMGRRRRWHVVGAGRGPSSKMVGGGGRCSPLVGWGAPCGWCWAVLAVGRGRWWAVFTVGMGSW